MNVMDSSGWLEYFADGPNANFFAPAIENLAVLWTQDVDFASLSDVKYVSKGKDDE